MSPLNKILGEIKDKAENAAMPPKKRTDLKFLLEVVDSLLEGVHNQFGDVGYKNALDDINRIAAKHYRGEK